MIVSNPVSQVLYFLKSFKQGSWISSLRTFAWSPRVLERCEARFREGAVKGGLFWTMKAAFIMDDEKRNKVYSRIVTAGGGNVVRYYKTLESLAAKLPGPREITHVFLDPGPKVIKLAEFKSVYDHCKSKNLSQEELPVQWTNILPYLVKSLLT